MKSKSHIWLSGGNPAVIAVSLLALLGVPILMAALWPDPGADFRVAAERIELNHRPGELVVLHPPGNAWYMDEFGDLPVVAPLKLKARDTRKLRGVWFVTPDPKRVKKLFRKVLKPYRKKGSKSFGDLTVLHYWAPKGGESR